MDNYPYIDTTIQENGQYYEIQLDRYQSFLVPIEPFKEELKKEFFKFVEFCKNENFGFLKKVLIEGF
ncbi:hypothetical protein [Lysinibacillus sp. FSL K6-3209]|uniref:hypothetical protein n=1 Tax=Lysinibacillus sp. FSL K6-3209 TaxID=2921497 RepID=UPI0030DBB3CA